MVLHGTYIGPDCGWNVTKGDTALLKHTDNPSAILAQFDCFTKARKGIDLWKDWHEFPAEHWVIDSPDGH